MGYAGNSSAIVTISKQEISGNQISGCSRVCINAFGEVYLQKAATYFAIHGIDYGRIEVTRRPGVADLIGVTHVADTGVGYAAATGILYIELAAGAVQQDWIRCYWSILDVK